MQREYHFDRETSPENWRVAMQGSGPRGNVRVPAASSYPGGGRIDRGLALAFTLAKHGRVAEARQVFGRVETGFEGQAEQPEKWRAEFVLVDAHIRAYEGRTLSSADIDNLKRTLEVADRQDYIGQGLALNQLCLAYVHSGHLDRAQEYGESAIRLYHQGDAELGSLHLLAHLGQIKLMRGDLEGAAAEYTALEERLSGLPFADTALLAVSRALRSEVAYETNELEESRALLESAIDSIEEDDAWLDVRAAAYRVRIRLALSRFGLPGALTELSRCEHAAEKRAMPRLLRLVKFERIRALTLCDELDGAQKIMRSIGIEPQKLEWHDENDWVFRQGSAAVAISRWLVRTRRARDALVLLEPVEDSAIRRGQLLTLAKLRVIRAEAHWRLNQKSDATSAIVSAVRLLGQQPFRRFILDEGPEVFRIVQAVLDGERLSSPLDRQHRTRFAELAHYFAVQTPDRRRNDAPSTGSPSTSAGYQKYLELLTIGLSNKEIARTMGVSVNTVKYHLKAIFADLRVSNRTQAVAEASRLKIIDRHHPDK
ncbi:LuxR C-terminal-related transcriptional regulator [Aliiruegeria lutimaris]|uniref:Regulatory protein, luxR family n=1 Tax=Aliiruegeria lutimaris TaxID=571298 RepID=A0A1G9ER47_9RHOB|nr:LuxR C-terminal-related transcriptional regulator [Aliiruegeria lutimaris]SDK78521.1 regulatory protein, luxR family [Aliiruegeria lutimaris]